MTTSVFDIFKIGLGPSSSHTVGPMKIAYQFLEDYLQFARNQGTSEFDSIDRVCVNLYGSLALTGKGHRTHDASMMGLSGLRPKDADPREVEKTLDQIRQLKQIALLGRKIIPFDPNKDILFHFKTRLPFHSNGMILQIFNKDQCIFERTYYSIGGGQILDDLHRTSISTTPSVILPFPYTSATELLAMGKKSGLRIDQMVTQNELVFRTQEAIEQELMHIWQVMQDCAQSGMKATGLLPGPLKIARRATQLLGKINNNSALTPDTNANPDFSLAMDWVTLWAIAINEENASGNRVVTAPTNGGAGTLPAVLHYYRYFSKSADKAGILKFLLVSGCVGIFYQLNASISAAEVGCQGEIGVACSMAAGGLAAALGASNEVIENAAEIGMEHNLGLTCDPVGGLVQIPCIERNVMGAIKAISAARLAMQGNGEHKISLDKVIKTMMQTGIDMQVTYKETSLGGLAVNVPEC